MNESFKIKLVFDSTGGLWQATVLPNYSDDNEHISKYNGLSAYGRTPAIALIHLSQGMNAVNGMEKQNHGMK